MTIEISDAARRRVQARVPVSRLQAVAQLPIVDAIRLPSYARRHSGLVTTEGDAIVHTDAVRKQFALDGTGVRVGVVSDGLKGVFATGCTTCAGVANGPISSGDLPAATGVRDANGVLTSSVGGIVGRSFQANGDLEGLPPASPACSFAGAGAEGTALLEIVHDLAPGAKLSFANGDTDLAFAQAVNFLAASNDVVVDDIGFLGLPYDGTSFVSSNTAAALNNPAFPIRAYYTAAGNDADEHYFGTYTDSGVDGTTISGIGTPGHLHLFQRTADTTDVLGLGSQPYNLIQLPQNGEVAIFLTWDDPFGASRNNYDLYLVQQSTGRVVAGSTDAQTGSQDPLEAIDYINTGSPDFFRIVIQNVRNSAQPTHLNMFSFQPQCAATGLRPLAPPRHERHNYQHGQPQHLRAIRCGRLAGGRRCRRRDLFGVGCGGGSPLVQRILPRQLESNHRVLQQPGPHARRPRQARHLGNRRRVDHRIGRIREPVLRHVGGGTAPGRRRRAGAAERALSAEPHQLDHRSGDGARHPAQCDSGDRVHLWQSDSEQHVRCRPAGRRLCRHGHAPRRAAGASSLTFPGNTPFGASLSAAQLGFTDPNSCPLTTLNWSGGCGTSPGSTMSCPFGASSVSVSASSNGFSFSGTTDFQITVTNYSVGVAPSAASVSAGQTAIYQVTVASQGGPFGSDVTLACINLPPQAACSFNPPTVSPGAASAQSILTISTAASSDTTPTAFRPRRFGWVPSWPSWPGLPMAAWSIAMATLWFGVRRTHRYRAVSWVAGAIVLAGVGGFALKGSGHLGVPVLSAAGEASGFAVFPANVVFDPQTVGTASIPRLVSITNVGTDTLNLTGLGINGVDFTQVNNCSTTIAPGASCSAAVTFTPTVAGLLGGTLTFVDNAPGGSQTVSLSGTGLAVPASTGATPSGTYVVTITGVTGTLTQSFPVTLTVQ